MTLKRLRQSQKLNWYTILWGIALIIVLYLAFNWYVEKNYIGIVERKTHTIGAQEPGKVNQLLVEIGDYVKKGQLLAMLDMTDLKTNLKQLKQELTSITEFEKANRTRYSIEVQRLGLQLENEASDLMDRLSLIESQSTRLAGLNTEIERLKSAKEAGLGQNRDLADLVLERDALASLLREQSKDLAHQSRELERARQTRQELATVNVDSLTKSLFVEKMEYAEEIKRRIAELEHRMSLRTIIAPNEGYVTDVFARNGDVVPEFAPILSVEESRSKFLTVYIPEKSNIPLEPGMTVEILSTRNRNHNTTGVINFVHPGFVQANERLSFRGQLFWARKVRVEIKTPHQFVPGEVVNARIKTNEINESYLSAPANASAQDTMENETKPVHPLIKTMNVPQSIWQKSRFEPSGVTWIPEIKKFIIVSDDTGIEDSSTDHAAYIFLMDENGNVDPNPVALGGIGTINDIEAITKAGPDIFYLASSQNISKKGKRPENREYIIKLKWDGNKFIVLQKIKFLSILVNSYSVATLKDLGLTHYEKDNFPVLNIEGATYHDSALYLGLKQPDSPRGAIIWKLDDVDAVFTTEKLQPNQLSVFGYVSLGEHKSRPATISDLIFDEKGVMWVTATIAGVDKENQMGGFFRINRFENNLLEAEKIISFPGVKPEGVCLYHPDEFLIVFDMDNKTPLYCYINAEAL